MDQDPARDWACPNTGSKKMVRLTFSVFVHVSWDQLGIQWPSLYWGHEECGYRHGDSHLQIYAAALFLNHGSREEYNCGKFVQQDIG